MMTLQEIETLCDVGDTEGATVATKEFFDHTLRGGPQSEDRAWLALRVAVLWHNEGDSVVSMVWTQRALTEGPRADAFALLGEIARLEEDWPLAARWFEISRETLCPVRCLRGVMDVLPERLKEHRRDLLHRLVKHGSSSRDHAFFMMSCAGREDLLWRSRESVDRPHVIVDKELRGQAATFFSVLRRAYVMGASYTTIFEDDVVGVRHLREYILRTQIDSDIAMVSWFHRWSPSRRHLGASFLVEKASNFSHNQAITLPLNTIEALLDSPQLKNWSTPHGADMLIGQVMPDARIAYHFPSLVDHVAGEQSLTGNTGDRRAMTFPGEDFDALSLIPAT